MLDMRILADDLTGALDAAARIVHACGPVPVRWTTNGLSLAGAMAFDTGSREASRGEAVSAVRIAMPLIAGAGFAYKKIDSLWRGNTAAEIVAAFLAGGFRHAVIAPAFPAQGRVTRAGRQWKCGADGSDELVPVDLVAALADEGFAVTRCTPGDAVPPGLSLWDADCDADLVRIAEAGRRLATPPMWCGSAGLAAALMGVGTPPRPVFEAPLTGVFGSDSPIIRRQLAAIGDRARRLTPDDPVIPAIYDLTPLAPLPRAEAAQVIASAVAFLCDRVARPASVVAAGGETLRSLCGTIGADHLLVDGEFEPGVPMSLVQGGRWHGVRIISKSGAFGDEGLLVRILAAARSVRHGEPVA